MSPVLLQVSHEEHVAALEQELLLYQEHAAELVRTAAAEITACQDELQQERQQHKRTQVQLDALQEVLGTVTPTLQTLTQRLKVQDRGCLCWVCWPSNTRC